MEIETYSSQAESYQYGSGTQQSIGLKMIEMLDLREGSTVLDLGCGTGYLTKLLAERVGPQGKVLAVDPDGERLKIARDNYSATNIHFIQADDQTFPSGQYDLIFSNIVIHWIKDKRALFRRVYDNLAPGGCFAFTTPNGPYPVPEIGQKLFDNLVGPDFLPRMMQEKMMFWNEGAYETLASNTGFTNTTADIIPDYPKWNNLDVYIDSMHGWLQGEFDPTKFNKHALEEIKQEYGSGPVVNSEPIKFVFARFTKTFQ